MDKHVWESATENAYLIRNSNLNGYGTLFGGTLMQWMDEMAGIVSRRHSRSEVRTAFVDDLTFTAPAGINDLIVLSGRVTYVGSTSMEIKIDAFKESDLDGGKRTLINTAYFVMVAVGSDGRPIKVPGLIVETPQEKAEYEAAKLRYENRKNKNK